MNSSQSNGNTFNFTQSQNNRVAVGNHNMQIDNVHGLNLTLGGRGHRQSLYQNRAPVAESDLAVLQRIFAGLRAQIAAEAPTEQKTAALVKIDELEDAIEMGQPDLSTMESVKNWFTTHMPTFAGAVTSVVVHPIVGKLVEAAGDMLAADFRDRFGNMS